VTLEALQSVVPETRLAVATDVQAPRSPGMKYRHYAPQARAALVDDLRLLKGDAASACIGLRAPVAPDAWARVQVCASVDEYAHKLFAFFRACDALRVQIIYCEAVEETGLGVALMDRLRRAAHP
jgi:L-threonylcarbamoyladenylate synthase